MSVPSLTKLQRYQLLRSQLDREMESFKSHWQELADFINPRGIRFTTTDRNRGSKRNQKIVNGAASIAARTLSAGMMSGITSPSRPWFTLAPPRPELLEIGAVKDWLHEVQTILETALIKSNFYNALPGLYRNMGVFGVACMIEEEDDEDDIRFFPFPVGEFRIALDSKLRVRVFLREYEATVRQLVEEFAPRDANGAFDFSNISLHVQQLWNRGQRDEWVKVCHVIQANTAYDGVRLTSKYKRWASCYFEVAGQPGTFLRESGYDEWPVLAPRWEVTGTDVYGTDCPGMTALGDVKQLMHDEKKSAAAIDKQVDPPMVVDPQFQNEPLSGLPGGLNWVKDDSGKGFRPAYQVNLDVSQLEAKIRQIEARIQTAFYADLFLMLTYADEQRSGQPVTAREIDERHEEKMLALGSVLEQLNKDLLNPVIDRTFQILLRRGKLPPAPPELQGMPLRVDYVSIMHAAQKMIGIGGLERTVGFISSIATTQSQFANAPILDKVNYDKMVDEYADMAGIAPSMLLSEEAVIAARKAKADAARAAAGAAHVQQLAGTARDLSQADTSKKNALTDLLGSGGADPLAAASGVPS